MALDRITKLKLAVESIVLLDKLVPVLGLGGLSSILWGVWGTLSLMAPIKIGLVMFAGFTLTVLLINGIRAFLKARTERLMVQSFKAWALVEKIPISDAAILLARSYDNSIVRPYFKMLKEKAEQGAIKAEKVEKGNYNMRSLISREELIRIAR